MMEVCCPRYRDLAKTYMENTKQRTAGSPWDSFIYGVALTMTRQSINHPEVIKELKQTYPTVEETRQVCAEAGEPYTPELNKTYSPQTVKQGMCLNASPKPIEERRGKRIRTKYPSWSHLEYSMKAGDREGVRRHYIFQQQKGPDMLLLEAGHDVPVMDVWMIRWLVDPEKERSVDDVTRYARQAQMNPAMYKMLRDDMIERAKNCGEPVGEYHVACWFEQLFRDDRDRAEKYLDGLIKAIQAETISE